MSTIDISIVVPFFNEEESIAPMHQALSDALSPLDIQYELIFVDDGSKDHTFEAASHIAAEDKHLRVIKFRKNYGQTPAMAAGIDHARGKLIITMDGDLQNDPSDIPLFLEKISAGYDIVVGWRHKRQDKLITRKIPSIIANKIIGKITGVPIKDNGCSLKAYKADIIQNVPLYSEMHRFIPAMLSLTGAKIAEIKVKHHARQFGVSKYGLSRIFKVLSDLITIKTIASFSPRPLLWFGSIGFAGFILSFIPLTQIFLNIISEKNEVYSLVIPMSMCMVFAGFGTFMIMTGVLCELVYKTGSLKIEELSKITTNVS